MKLSAPDEDETRLRALVRTYRDMIRNGIVRFTWTMAALVAAGAAFLILRVTWSLLLLALKAVGEI